MTDADDAVLGGVREPLYLYLQRCRDAIPGLTRDHIAWACGFKSPNVVSMIFNGGMPLPLARVPALAEVLRIEKIGLLRRVLQSSQPEVVQVIDEVLGAGAILTNNEAALLRLVRTIVGADDPALAEDRTLREGLADLLLQARDRHLRAGG